MSESKDLLLRSITLLQLIPHWPKSISTPDLLDKLKAEGFQINLRSLQRDLRDLSSRLAIVSDEKTRPYRWSIREGVDHGLPAQDTPSSALALYLAESHLNHLLPQSVLDLLRPQFRNARNQLDGMQHNHLAHWSRRVRSLPNGKALLPAELEPQVWTQVSSALLERRQLQVDYLSRSKGEAKCFRIHPAGLVSRHSISYLIGTVNDYDDLRQFALHRIQSAELLNEPARENEDFDVDRYIEGGAFAWRQSPHEVELIADVHPQLAWLLGETPLSHTQRLEPLQGSDWQRLRASVPLDQETLWWIFGLNDQIRVHAPQAWVEEIGRKLESLRKMYAASPQCDTGCRQAVEDSAHAPVKDREDAEPQTAEEVP